MGKSLENLILIQVLHCTPEYRSLRKNKYIALSSKTTGGHKGTVVQDKL